MSTSAAERPLTGDLPYEKDPHPFGFDMSSVSLVDVIKSRTKGDVFSPNGLFQEICVVTNRLLLASFRLRGLLKLVKFLAAEGFNNGDPILPRADAGAVVRPAR